MDVTSAFRRLKPTLLYKKIKIMAEAAVIPKKERKTKEPAEKIPDYLIYEISGVKPIYYRGYRDVIKKTKTFEEIKMERQLQAGLKARLSAFIGLLLLKLGYEIAVGELGH